MTVINGIEIDNINYKLNDIKYAISNNDPIEQLLPSETSTRHQNKQHHEENHHCLPTGNQRSINFC